MKSTKEDLEDLKNLFNLLDIDKDGTLEIEEIRAGLKNISTSIAPNSDEFLDLVLTMDADGSGTVDY